MEEQESRAPTSASEPQKILAYIMPDQAGKKPSNHKFMTLRRTTKNNRNRYVTAEQFFAVGLYWPTSIAKDRDELALLIGRAILDETGV